MVFSNSNEVIVDYTCSSGTSFTTSSPFIVYNDILYSVTGFSTNLFSSVTSGITSGITINSGFTLNLKDVYSIDRMTLLEVLVNYVYDSVDTDINKYMIRTLITNSGQQFTTVTRAGDYCVKIWITDSYGASIYDYFIMHVINERLQVDRTYYMTPEAYSNPIITQSDEIKVDNYCGAGISSVPTIYYSNLVYSGVTGYTTTNYSLINSAITSGITISSGFTYNLKKIDYIDRSVILEEIISYVYDAIDIDLNKYKTNITILNESQNFVSISGIGNYCVKISITNKFGATATDYFIMSIIKQIIEVDHTYYMPVQIAPPKRPFVKSNPITVISAGDCITPPKIIYQYGVLTNWDDSTDNYTGVTSAVTSGFTITNAFMLNLQGFDQRKITRLDIINDVVDYVYSEYDLDLNKYMLEVLILDKNFIYTEVTQRGDYLVKLKITDEFGNSVEDYLIMRVVDGEEDFACFPGGMWRDHKVWIDTYLWIDHM